VDFFTRSHSLGDTLAPALGHQRFANILTHNDYFAGTICSTPDVPRQADYGQIMGSNASVLSQGRGFAACCAEGLRPSVEFSPARE
jgi:hypothetical protein